jgi:hypothetical protein
VTTDQAQAVYAAEDLWSNREPRARTKFGDWNEVWPFYYTLAERCREHGMGDVKVPKVKPRRGALQAHYDTATRTVYIPPYDKGGIWALTTGTAIHEFAHHVSPGAGHGPAFRQAMVDVVSALGWDSELLADCYAQAGLTTSDKAESITDRVSTLLTHADGKGRTAEEKKTFLEKAERLAAEHSVNLALLRKKQADAGKHAGRPITGEMYSLMALPSTTFRNLAVELGSAICRAHGAHCTIRGKSQWMTFYGFAEDVHLTELMLARVTPMMFEESELYLRTPEHKTSGVAGVSARITFCQNFAWEVGRRLAEAVRQTEKTVGETLAIGDGTVSTELVLREKAIEVADYVAYEFKRQGVKGAWKGSRSSNWSGTAADAGKDAAQRANLYGRKELE